MSTTTIEKTKFRPPEIAAAWGVSVEKILSFIHAGELRAINAANPGRNQRPRFLIDVKDLADFERRRTVQQPPTKPRRRGRRVTDHPDDRY